MLYLMSSGSATTGMKTSAARIWPPWVPVSVQEVKNERRSSGACSSVSELAPACSPAAESPCSSRHSTSSAGAPQPIGVVRRQAADQERRDAHQQQGEQQHLLPADPVAEVADEDRADRAGDVGEAERRERQHQGGGVVAGEEDVREDQCGGGAEDEEVVVLHGAAHEAGQRGLARRLAAARSARRVGGALHRFSSWWVARGRPRTWGCVGGGQSVGGELAQVGEHPVGVRGRCR